MLQAFHATRLVDLKTVLFITVILASGAFAGLIHGTVNLALVEPYLDYAIGIENQNLFESGVQKDTPEFQIEYEGYRMWQKGGQVLAGVILGTSMGALFGMIFALSKDSLPGCNYVKKSLLLAGIMWLVLYFVPFLKYPANPPSVGDADTLVLRTVLYLSLITISAMGALVFYKISKRFRGRRKLASLVGYAALMGVVFLAMPENPDEVPVQMTWFNEFRLMSVLGVSSFWLSVGLILGLLWGRLEPHKDTPENY